MNHYDEIRKFIANEVIQVGHTIIDPTTGTNESATMTSIGPNSHDAEWFYVTVNGDRRVGSRQGAGWPIPS